MASLKPLMLCLALMFLFLCFSSSEARDFLVGGRENSWKVPSSQDELNKWSAKMRFVIGDTIVLKYDPKTDSVLQVREVDYTVCNTSAPIKSYNDGNTKIPLDRSGHFYFISGTAGHCEHGQKIMVTVLSLKHRFMILPPVASPAPAPAPAPAPVPSPAEGGLFPFAPVGTAGRHGLKSGWPVGVAIGLRITLVGLALFM